MLDSVNPLLDKYGKNTIGQIGPLLEMGIFLER
jgi:hypothetical protein